MYPIIYQAAVCKKYFGINYVIIMLQVHTGVKGVVRDAQSGRGLAGVVIHVKNITQMNDTHARDDHIDHDVITGN